MSTDVIASSHNSAGPAPVTSAKTGLTVDWTIVPDQTHIRWTASKRYFMLIPARAHGQFRDVTGTVRIEGSDLTTARVRLTASTASQDSGVARRDKHLQGPDFFDAPNHPEITFTSTAIHRLPGHAEHYAVQGNLEVRGAQKPITLEGTWTPIAGGWANVELSGTVSRSELGLNWSGKPMLNLLDPIELRIDAELRPANQ